MADNDEKITDYVSLEQTIKLWPKSWLDGNLWISPAAGFLYEQYRDLRQDLCKNATTWNYSEYCERTAFHYYNIASFYNDLFRQCGVDLGSVRKWLIKCLEKLSEETTIESSINLKRDAEQCLVEVNQLFQQIVSQTVTTRKQIQLGLDFDSSSMKTCTQQEICQLQGVKVLKLINNLEEELSLPEQKHIVTTINQCSCLAEIYTLANRPDLSKYYVEAMQNYIDKFNNIVSPISFNERANMDKIIASEVEEYKSTVKQIVTYLEESYCEQLNSYDVAYIEKKYLDFCTEFWQTEISDYLKKIIDEKNADAIQNMFNNLNLTKNLSTIPNMFHNSEYLDLLKMLKLSENDEKKLVQKFKQQCWNCLVEFSSSAKIELRFIENFVDFLSFTPELENAIVMLELKAFLRDEITLQDLLGSVSNLDSKTYGEELAVLKETAQSFVQPYDMFLLDKFKHLVSGFLQPAVLEIKKIDGRLVAEVTGKIIFISKIKQDLEEKLRVNSNIEEVRFVGAQVLHIDANFSDAIWKGKNIVVLVKTIKIYNNTTWDVSGKDNDHTYTEKAAAEKDGTDGFAGESGGNVLILGKYFDKAVSLTVLSNGGMGSPGQDGGDGKNGDDGKGIEKYVLDDKFKSLAGIFRMKFKRDFFKNIDQACSEPHFTWHSKYNDFYMEALTRDGNKIFYSFCNGSPITCVQNYFIYKGSLGKPGTQAGKGGLGGEGGLCGHIEIENYEDGNSCFEIAYKVENGQDGQNGQGGLSGKHGKNGWDMAFIDFELWPNPTYYGEDYKSTCTATCYDERASDRVVCPYNDDKYVGITVSKLEHPSQERFRNASLASRRITKTTKHGWTNQHNQKK